MDEYVGLRCGTGPGCLLVATMLLVGGLASVRPCKSRHCNSRMAFLLQKEPKNAFTPGLRSSRAQLLPHGYAIQCQRPEQSISSGAECSVKNTSHESMTLFTAENMLSLAWGGAPGLLYLGKFTNLPLFSLPQEEICNIANPSTTPFPPKNPGKMMLL